MAGSRHTATSGPRRQPCAFASGLVAADHVARAGRSARGSGGRTIVRPERQFAKKKLARSVWRRSAARAGRLRARVWVTKQVNAARQKHAKSLVPPMTCRLRRQVLRWPVRASRQRDPIKANWDATNWTQCPRSAASGSSACGAQAAFVRMTAVHNHRSLVEASLEKSLVGVVANCFRHQAFGIGDHAVGRNDDVAFDAAQSGTSSVWPVASGSVAPEGAASWRARAPRAHRR